MAKEVSKPLRYVKAADIFGPTPKVLGEMGYFVMRTSPSSPSVSRKKTLRMLPKSVT